MIQFFGYPKCSTCRKASKYLDGKKIKYKDIDITETPPSKTLLKAILKSGDYELKDLFNKSGVLYREMNMKDKLKDMSETQALALLAQHGKLVKRPIVSDGSKYSVGFKEDVFKKIWK